MQSVLTILRARFFLAWRTHLSIFATECACDLPVPWVTAVRAERETLGCMEILIQCDALIEHEALALELLARALFQVLQDAAIELKHIGIPQLAHGDLCLFTPNASGAVHQHFLVLCDLGFLHVIRKL